MGNQGLRKLLHAPLKRILPNLCPFCQHMIVTEKGDGLDWACEVYQKFLSIPHTDKGKCEAYEPSPEPKITQAQIDELHEDVKRHREYLQQWKAKRAKGAFWL